MNVSVIIPTYNRAGELLEKAIDSVLAQTHQLIEIIIVDDGSTDGTSQSLKTRYRDHLDIVRTGNQGPAAARNVGIKKARYDLIAFLDSDDWWDQKKLEVQVQIMTDNPTYLVSHTDEIWYRRGIFLNQKNKHSRPHGDIFKHCLPLCCVGMSTVMMRHDFFEKVGLFDESLPCCEDYDLWLRASRHAEFYKIDQPLTYKQGGRDDQVSVQYRVGMDKFRITSLEKCLHLDGFTPEQKKLIAKEIVRKATIYGNGCVKHGRMDEGWHYLELAQRWTTS